MICHKNDRRGVLATWVVLSSPFPPVGRYFKALCDTHRSVDPCVFTLDYLTVVSQVAL